MHIRSKSIACAEFAGSFALFIPVVVRALVNPIRIFVMAVDDNLCVAISMEIKSLKGYFHMFLVMLN